MENTLYAGVTRRLINPPLGIRRPGIRLFADPIQAIESDLTATALVLANGVSKVAVLACDLAKIPMPVVSDIRRRIGAAIHTPASHVMINVSHTHSGPTFPEFIEDTPEQMRLQRRYRDDLIGWLVEVTREANEQLQAARIGAGWGECRIGVYRRETGPDGKDHLGAVPDAPIDPSVGVIRVDDLDGNPIAVLFSYGCHPVTMGPRSLVASADFPGAAREVVEKVLGGTALFLQACGGNINPVTGIGYEVDCRDNKNRIGTILGGEVLKVASNVRTHVRRGSRTSLGSLSSISLWPWEPVEGDTYTYLGAIDETIKLQFIDLPALDEAERIRDQWHQRLADERARGARDWDINVAAWFAHWADILVDAVRDGHPTLDFGIQAIRVNDIILAGLSADVFFETGLAIKTRSPFEHTEVLGYTNGRVCYLPRAEDYPPAGWDVHKRYAVPDMFFQANSLPVAIHPNSERMVVEQTLKLIQQLNVANAQSAQV